MRRNPLDERWSLNTIRWLEEGPYAHVPAVRRLADELRDFEGPRTATEYRALKKKIETVFEVLEARGRLEPEDEAAAITKALLEGSLGIAESGVARPMPGTRQGPLRDIEERHPQAGQRQRQRERDAGGLWQPARPGYSPTAEERTAEAQGEDPLVKEWNLGYDLDGGGYSFERVRGTSLGNAIELLLHENSGVPLDNARRAVESMLMWESPDLDGIIGGDVMPGSDRHHGRASADLLLIVPGASDWPWPDKIPEPDAEGNLGNLMFEKRAEGGLYETDHQCSWCEGTGQIRPEGLERVRTCTRCDGDGYVNSPGGAWAIYERVEIEEEEEEEEEIPDEPRIDNQWCDTHETSRPVADAIVERVQLTVNADPVLAEVENMWGSPSPADITAIWSRAWELDDSESESLHWGASTRHRAFAIEEEGDPDELLSIDLTNEELDVLQGWYSGQGDPLYALQSSGTLERGRISSATSNLSAILRDAEQGDVALTEDEGATIEGLIEKLEATTRLNR